ncbi:MAG: NHL repeat-containing protein [Desulfuromonadales bacterium]
MKIFFLTAGLAVTMFGAWVFAQPLTALYDGESRVALSNPHDLKLSPDGRYLMVADVGQNRIAILDPDSLELVGEFGADHQSGTHDIDFDEQGLAYVADTHNNRVTIYRLEGTRATQIGALREGIRGPEGVLAHPNGRIYVAGAWSGNVVAYADGKKVGELTGLSSPHDLELAADGDLWLADAGNDRILLLTADLAIKDELGRESYGFRGVRYLDLLADGTLIAADKNSHAVKFIGSDRSLRLQIGDGTASRGEYRLTTPEGVEVRGDRIWISDSGNDRIVRYRLQPEPKKINDRD